MVAKSTWRYLRRQGYYRGLTARFSARNFIREDDSRYDSVEKITAISDGEKHGPMQTLNGYRAVVRTSTFEVKTDDRCDMHVAVPDTAGTGMCGGWVEILCAAKLGTEVQG